MTKKTPKPNAWASRLVGEGEADPRELLPNPKNWRVHPRHQQEALDSVLEKVGWVQRVIVNKRTGNLVDGHLRVSRAIEKGEASVPVAFVDLSPEEEGLVLASLDPIASMAATDAEMLSGLLSELEAQEAIPEDLLGTLKLLEGLDVAAAKSLEDVAFQAGKGGEDDLWPVIKIKVSPDAERVWAETWEKLKGSDSERVVALCAAAKL